jgi:hypothetical protein
MSEGEPGQKLDELLVAFSFNRSPLASLRRPSNTMT